MHLKRNATSMNTLFKYVWQKSASWSNLFKYLICSNSQHFGLRISLASIWPLLACYYAQMVKWLPWKGTGPKGSIPRAGRIFQLWTLFSWGHQNGALCSILWQLGGCHFFFLYMKLDIPWGFSQLYWIMQNFCALCTAEIQFLKYIIPT